MAPSTLCSMRIWKNSFSAVDEPTRRHGGVSASAATSGAAKKTATNTKMFIGFSLAWEGEEGAGGRGRGSKEGSEEGQGGGRVSCVTVNA